MTPVEKPATRREWLGLAVLMLPTVLLALDMTVLHLAAPHLSADLQPTSAELLWILDIYGFMIAGFLGTMGTLGDRIGRLCQHGRNADCQPCGARHCGRHADAINPVATA